MNEATIRKKLAWLENLRHQQQERLERAQAEIQAATVGLHKIAGAHELLSDLLLTEFPPEKEPAEFLANGMPAEAGTAEGN